MRIKIKRHHKKRRSSRSAKTWMAAGTFAAYSFIGAHATLPVYAQKNASTAPQTQSNLPARRFDIPAGPLDGILSAFQNGSDLRVIVANPGIFALQSPGVSGLFTPEQALTRLLRDTGVDFRFTGSLEVTLDLKAVTSSIDVTTTVEALAGSSPKYSASNLDTPQTITAIPQEVLQQQGTTTLRDALRNVAGISLAAGEGGSQGDNLTIRGFSARNDLFIDGMRDFGSYYRDPFNTQEVEVLQGPSSVTFGRGSTGGVVNQATKIPGMSRFIAADVDFGTDVTRRGTLDINSPISLFGHSAAFRVNLMGNENNIAGRDIAENRRWGVAPSLAFGLGTPTRLTFNYFHQQADDTPDYGIPWLFNAPAPVNRHNYYGFQDGNYLRTKDDLGTVKLEHDLNSKFTVRNQLRYANYYRNVLITEAKTATTLTLATPLAAIQLTRNQLGSVSAETYLDEQLDLVGHVKTGFIQHTLVTGVEAGRETSDPTRPTWTNVPTANLLSPNESTPFSGTYTITSRVNTTARSVAAYILDTMQLGRHWDLTGGIRYDRFDTDYTQSVAPATAFNRVDNMPSWRSALVYKPVAIGSVYFAAGTSFNPSAESLSLSATTVSLPPEKNRTYEFGTKWDLPNRRLSLRAAVFQTTKLNAREPDPTNSLLNVLAGTQRVNGAQLEVRGRITNRWDILGSYANLDSKVISSNAYPASIGAQLANVPRNTFNFWSTYRFPKRWEGGIGGNYVSSRTASSTVPNDPTTGLLKQVSGYWVFNAMVERPLNEHVSIQVNAYNLTNRYYYDQLHPGHIILGAGRSALVGFKFKF